MSTTINTNYSSYFNVNNDTKDRIISESKEASQGQKTQANASVEISMDGLKKYKESTAPEKGVILSDQSTYNAMITDKMPSTYGEKDADGNYSRIYYSPRQTADNMVEAYGEAMDEIVQGYKNGTRETYVEDKSAEGGVRKLTMEEELAELDKAFEAKTKQYEKEHDPKILNALKDHAKKVNELSSGRAKISKDGEKLVENAIKEMPKEFSKNVVKAANNFAEQYRLQMSGKVDISALLKGIKPFKD